MVEVTFVERSRRCSYAVKAAGVKEFSSERGLRRHKCDSSVAFMATLREAAAKRTSDLTGTSHRWVYLWAPVGGAVCLLVAVVLVRWAANGPHSVPPGPDHFGGVNLFLLRALEGSQFAAFIALIGWFVIRPVLLRQKIGFDGMFILASFAMNIWDPLDNYWTFAFQYNAHFLNVGSWGGYIPGWHGPSPELWAVPLAFIFGCYTWSWFVAVRFGSWLLDRLRSSRPSWPEWQRYLVVYLAVAAQSGISEVVFLRLGHWTYPTTVERLTAWHGETYAWPLFNPVIYGLTWLVMVWLRETSRRDSGGLTTVESGLDQWNLAPWQRATLRFAALFGFMSVVYILTYFLPFNLIVAHGTLNTHLPSYFPVP